MLAIKINDIKTFMNQLLIGDTFDAFPMAEASIAAFSTFSIDGRINKDFFDTDTQDIPYPERGDLFPVERHKTFCSQHYPWKSFCLFI